MSMITELIDRLKSMAAQEGAFDDKIKSRNAKTLLEAIDTIQLFRQKLNALQTEPFINKPCISEGVCHEDKMMVLEKIKAEIDEDHSHTFNDGCINKNYVLSVIDKYMKESEEV